MVSGSGLGLVPALRGSQQPHHLPEPGKSTQEPFKAPKAQVTWEDPAAPLGLGQASHEKVGASLVLLWAILQSPRLQKGSRVKVGMLRP